MSVASSSVRIFIGSSSRNLVEQLVFVHSLRKHAGVALEVNIIDGETGAVTFESGEVRKLPAALSGRLGGATAFSVARFAIPEWCGYEGRAIYCDSDQIVLTDIAELWNHRLDGHSLSAVPARRAQSSKNYLSTFLDGLIAESDDYYL